MFKLPKILSFDSPNARIGSGLFVRDLLAVFKRMRVENYFSRIHVGSDRFVQQTNVYWESRSSGPDPKVEYLNLTTSYFCNRDPFWIAEVSLRFANPYVTEGEDEDSLTRIDWNRTCYDADLINMLVRSKESRSAFESSVRALLTAAQTAENEIRRPHSWESRGLEATILCRCGHSLVVDVAKLIGGRACDDIFALRAGLRCSACGEKGRAELLPTYRKRPFSSPKSSSGFGRNKSYNSDNDDVDFYKVLDGDGANDAYLGDGIYVRPDGKLYDG